MKTCRNWHDTQNRNMPRTQMPHAANLITKHNLPKGGFYCRVISTCQRT